VNTAFHISLQVALYMADVDLSARVAESRWKMQKKIHYESIMVKVLFRIF
jgi:hypothetical protein